MTNEQGIEEIDNAKWLYDPEYKCLNMIVHDKEGRENKVNLSLRLEYCDRGHIQLLIDGYLDIDWADSFPRYFFSFEEADRHTREFLKWRIWDHRTHPHELFPRYPVPDCIELKEEL